MIVTKEDLRRYRDMKDCIQALQAEINASYSPVGSPSTEMIGSHSTTPGDPTAQAVHRIEAKRERLRKKIEEYVELTERIERFVDEVEKDDLTVANIIRFYFLAGFTWRKTCMMIYKRSDPDVCRVTFHRYMEKLERSKV